MDIKNEVSLILGEDPYWFAHSRYTAIEALRQFPESVWRDNERLALFLISACDESALEESDLLEYTYLEIEDRKLIPFDPGRSEIVDITGHDHLFLSQCLYDNRPSKIYLQCHLCSDMIRGIFVDISRDGSSRINVHENVVASFRELNKGKGLKQYSENELGILGRDSTRIATIQLDDFEDKNVYLQNCLLSICLGCFHRLLRDKSYLILDPRTSEFLLRTDKSGFEQELKKQFSHQNKLVLLSPLEFARQMKENDEQFRKFVDAFKHRREAEREAREKHSSEVKTERKRAGTLLQEQHFNEVILAVKTIMDSEWIAHYGLRKEDLEKQTDNQIRTKLVKERKILRVLVEEYLFVRSLRNRIVHQGHQATEDKARLSISRMLDLVYPNHPELR